MANAALVLGIVSVVLVLMPGFNIIALITGIIGVIFGALSAKKLRSENQPTGIANAGLITSIVGLALSVILYISCLLCFAGTSCAMTVCTFETLKTCNSITEHPDQQKNKMAQKKRIHLKK